MSEKRTSDASSEPTSTDASSWIRGFATGLAEVSRLTHDHKASRQAMRAAGLTLDKLREAGANAFDVDEIAKGGET